MNWKKLFVKFIDNWPAKVLSLLLAIILFIFHRMSTLETRFFSRPIVLEHLNAMTPSGSYPRMIRVSIRGEAGSIYSILEEDIEIYVDMEKFETPGAYSVPVLWRKKGTALGVAPLQISVDPVEITFSLDRRISKFVPITASFRGQLEAGFNMTSFSINPAQVIIEGPAEIISGVFELYTENVDLDGRTSDFSTTVNILRRDPMVMIRGDGTTEFSGNISQ
ncbi:MAG: hypothetical protein LBH42_01800, partial [Treponema sp.]|nr:hypothetical protein [Treponema sp.]